MTMSTNYCWYTSGDENNCKTYRGTAILIHKQINSEVLKFLPIVENLCMIDLHLKGTLVSVFSTHVPSDRRLGSYYEEMSEAHLSILKRNVILAGDFNGHLGKNDATPQDVGLIGPKLKHMHSNKAGTELRNLTHLHKLRIHSTFSNSNTVLTTWSKRGLESQIDHILSSKTCVLGTKTANGSTKLVRLTKFW